MYQGLPIVTNKIPLNEMNGVSHHLLDTISLYDKPWTVRQFVDESSRIISDIRARGKLPVVVGGTNYYIYSMLFRDVIMPGSSSENSDAVDLTYSDGELEKDDKNGMRDDEDLSMLSTEQLYARLKSIDPAMASKWHPQDRRKIQRSLEIFVRSGRIPSEVYAEQGAAKSAMTRVVEGGSVIGDLLLFWLDAENTALRERLDKRVDSMVENGLLDEVREMRRLEQSCQKAGFEIDQSKGIWVAIGYKQLVAWLDALEKDVSHFDLTKLREQGVEAIKSATRQYAKRQNRWIRIRLAKSLESSGILNQLYLLDGTDLGHWSQTVEQPTFDIVQGFLEGNELPTNVSLSKMASKTLGAIEERDVVERQAFECEVCCKVLMSDQEWQQHLQSSTHKKVLAGVRKRAQRDEYLAKSGVSVYRQPP